MSIEAKLKNEFQQANDYSNFIINYHECFGKVSCSIHCNIGNDICHALVTKSNPNDFQKFKSLKTAEKTLFSLFADSEQEYVKTNLKIVE